MLNFSSASDQNPADDDGLPGLSRKHRAWVALYSLENPAFDRRQVLRENDVTESDLVHHTESWMQLRRQHRQKQR
ncbi:hypothetical protein [Hymenobacter psychrophilus]|uniref:Uncharacterized protein n=1 Tax=Hymenobacter psychrophilus TaxID=651662 RepID=A0A1H3LM72_9BACT|nr:hypothetical protein [Hymenobacter psychrophilus]SDY65511.1 hypothetical protein SAMN04488069_11148 [Hymenobacter psychrophilus]